MPESQIQVHLNPDVPPTGSDLSIVNAARRSFNTRSEWVYSGVDTNGPHEKGLKEKDKRLLQFLARGMTADDFAEFSKVVAEEGSDVAGGETTNGNLLKLLWEWRNTPTHDTPFNHTFISFEVKAPIFVARQLVKHEYLIMSEFSRRYITDGIEFYEPDYWRKAAPNKKQGSLKESAGFGVGYMSHVMGTCTTAYNELIDGGVAPEQARMVLPQSTMTEWTWSGTLGAFAKMCQLRLHPEAQYEARLVAQQVYEYLKEYWPIGAPALVEGPDV